MSERSEAKIINRQKFMAELSKLLTFMYEEDRLLALSIYERMFDVAEDEQQLIQGLLSPTRQAVVIARAYDAKERKLSVSSHSREEDGYEVNEDEEPAFVEVIYRTFEEIIPSDGLSRALVEDQLSFFDRIQDDLTDTGYVGSHAEGYAEDIPGGDVSQEDPQDHVADAVPESTVEFQAIRAGAHIARDPEPEDELLFDVDLFPEEPEDALSEGNGTEEPMGRDEQALPIIDPVSVPDPKPEYEQEDGPADGLESEAASVTEESVQVQEEDSGAAPSVPVEPAAEAESQGAPSETEPAAEGTSESETESLTVSEQEDDFFAELRRGRSNAAEKAAEEIAQEEVVPDHEPDQAPVKQDETAAASSERKRKRTVEELLGLNEEPEAETEKTSKEREKRRHTALSSYNRKDREGKAPEKAEAPKTKDGSKEADKKIQSDAKSSRGRSAGRTKDPEGEIEYSTGKRILFYVIAVPVTLLLLVLLLIPTLIALFLSVGLILLGAMLILAAFSGFAVLADILLLIGGAAVSLALGLLLLWIACWLMLGVIADLFRKVGELDRRFCRKEVARA